LFHFPYILIFTIVMHSSVVWPWSWRLPHICISMTPTVAHLCLVGSLISSWRLILLFCIWSWLNFCYVKANIILLLLLDNLLLVLLGPYFWQLNINLLFYCCPPIFITIVCLLICHYELMERSLWISFSHYSLEHFFILRVKLSEWRQ